MREVRVLFKGMAGLVFCGFGQGSNLELDNEVKVWRETGSQRLLGAHPTTSMSSFLFASVTPQDLTVHFPFYS